MIDLKCGQRSWSVDFDNVKEKTSFVWFLYFKALLKKFCIGVELMINNVVRVSGEEPRDSATQIHVSESESVSHSGCPTLCYLVDCSLPGSSVHGILQARILETVAIPFSRGSSPSRDQTWVSCRRIPYQSEPPGPDSCIYFPQNSPPNQAAK